MNRSPRSQMNNRWNGREMNACFLALGCFIGFLTSSFVTLSTFTDRRENMSLLFEAAGRNSSVNRIGTKRQSVKDGWSLVHVFSGEEDQILHDSTISESHYRKALWFSQVRQDEIVAKLLHEKKNGYFVDLAANDAVRISNTYALERNLGWTGLCIEPNSVYWRGLSHRSCHTIGAVVGDRRGQVVPFRFPREKAPQGGIVGENFDNKVSKQNEMQLVTTTTLADVFQRFQTPKVIDYLSLDVEGAEFLVMDSFPFHEYTISVLTIERPSPELETLLKKNGYILLKQLKHWGETLWVHQSVRSRLNMDALVIDSEHYKYTEAEPRKEQAPSI